MRADIITTNLGTIITIEAATKRGHNWLDRNVGGGVPLHTARINCEHRQGMDILEGALADGLRLQDSTTGRTAGGTR